MRVVVAGHSNLMHSPEGPEMSSIALLHATLTRLAPSAEWECLPAYVPMLRPMAASIEEAIHEARPDAAVLTLTGTAFAQEYVLNKLRRRWRRLYRPMLHSARWLKDAARATDPVFTPRRLLFRLPEALAFRIIGGEPYMRLDRAIEIAKDAIETLVRHEDVVTVVRLPGVSFAIPPGRRKAYGAKVQVFNAAVTEVCRRRHVDYFNIVEELERAGRKPGVSQDLTHFDAQTRQFEAQVTAAHILSGLGMKSPAIAGHEAR